MEKWIQQWEYSFGVAPRLSEFFSSPGGKDLLKEFVTKKEGRTDADPQILAFLLVFWIWPGIDLECMPSREEQKQEMKTVKKAVRSLRTSERSGLVTGSQEGSVTSDELKGCVRNLEKQLQFPPSVLMGNLRFSGSFLNKKRESVRTYAVMILTGYFEYLNWPKPPWKIITKFLVLTGLVKKNSSSKHIASWWSKTKGGSNDHRGTIDVHQESWVKLFLDVQDKMEKTDVGLVTT